MSLDPKRISVEISRGVELLESVCFPPACVSLRDQKATSHATLQLSGPASLRGDFSLLLKQLGKVSKFPEAQIEIVNRTTRSALALSNQFPRDSLVGFKSAHAVKQSVDTLIKFGMSLVDRAPIAGSNIFRAAFELASRGHHLDLICEASEYLAPHIRSGSVLKRCAAAIKQVRDSIPENVSQVDRTFFEQNIRRVEVSLKIQEISLMLPMLSELVDQHTDQRLGRVRNLMFELSNLLETTANSEGGFLNLKRYRDSQSAWQDPTVIAVHQLQKITCAMTQHGLYSQSDRVLHQVIQQLEPLNDSLAEILLAQLRLIRGNIALNWFEHYGTELPTSRAEEIRNIAVVCARDAQMFVEREYDSIQTRLLNSDLCFKQGFEYFAADVYYLAINVCDFRQFTSVEESEEARALIHKARKHAFLTDSTVEWPYREALNRDENDIDQKIHELKTRAEFKSSQRHEKRNPQAPRDEDGVDEDTDGGTNPW